MANVIVYVDVRAGHPTTPSRFALTEARRLADALGATVFALVFVGTLPAEEIDELAGAVGRAGADRVLFGVDAKLEGPPIDASHGALLSAVTRQIRPLLVLFPAGTCGPALGPSLAVRVGGAFAPHAALEIGRGGTRLLVRRWRPGGDGMRTLDVAEMERTVVVTLGAGTPAEIDGARPLDPEMLAVGPPRSAGVERIDWCEDARQGDLVSTAVIVEDGVDGSALETRGSESFAILREGDALAEGACPSRLLVLGAGRARWPALPITPETHLAVVAPKGVDKGLPAGLVLRTAPSEVMTALAATLPGDDQ